MDTVKIKGLNEIKKNLKNLSEKKSKQILTAGLRAGATEISKKAKQNAPSESGELKQSIGITKRRSKNKSFIKFTVSPETKTRTRKGEKVTVSGRYAVNVEYGTQFQAAQPFMRNTFDELGENVTNSITKKMAQRIEKEGNKS